MFVVLSCSRVAVYVRACGGVILFTYDWACDCVSASLRVGEGHFALRGVLGAVQLRAVPHRLTNTNDGQSLTYISYCPSNTS